MTISLWLLPILYTTLASCLIAFSMAARATRQLTTSVAAPPGRIAELFPEDTPPSWWVAGLEWVGMLLPLAIPAVAVGILILHWQQLPVDPLWHPFTDVVFAAFFGILPAGTQFALRFHARSSDWDPDARASRRYRALLGFRPVLVFSFISLQICILSTMPVAPFRMRHHYFTFTFWGYAVLFPLVIGIRVWLKSNVAKQSGDPMSDNCWKWGMFYANAEDPAWVVPSRSGAGLSYNYGQRVITFIGAVVVIASLASIGCSYWRLMLMR